MMARLAELFDPPWAWIVAGLVLAIGEVAAPGVFLIWLGVAAVATGLLAFVAPLPWQAQMIEWAVLAAISVVVGRRLTRVRSSGLHRRGRGLVGQAYRLDEPIIGGHGRLRLSDTSWRLSGPDAPAGTGVRIVDLDGTTLVVVPLSPDEPVTSRI